MQAVIITAHHNLSQVYELARLLHNDFLVYIHFDKKVSFGEIKKLGFEKLRNVKIYSLFKINWAGANLLWAILHLMQEILLEKEVTHVHIISGEDFPCRPAKQIFDFFADTGDVYMEFSEIGKTNKIHLQKYYSFLNLIEYKKFFGKLLVRGMWFLQKLVGVNRLNALEFPLYSGLVWGTLPCDAVKCCFDFMHGHPDFLCFLEYGFASEEFFFGTALMQSEYWKNHCVPNNFRYMQWEKRNGSYPAILDESDIEKIQAGECFFIRKVRLPASEKLLESLCCKD